MAADGSADPSDGVDRASLSDSAQSVDILRALPGMARWGGGSGLWHKLVGFEQLSATLRRQPEATGGEE
jgi:hypothetical protein